MSFRFCGDMAGRKLASPTHADVYHASHFTAGKDFFFALALTLGSFVVKFFFALFPTALLLYQSISSRVVLSLFLVARLPK